MPDELVYQGYSIRADPCQLGSGWTFEGILVEDGKPSPHQVRFYSDGTAQSREVAVARILAEGKRLIDYRSELEGPAADTAVAK